MPSIWVSTSELLEALADIDDDCLIDEVKDRGYHVGKHEDDPDFRFEVTELTTAIYEKRRLGQDYQKELDDLLWETIGRVV